MQFAARNGLGYRMKVEDPEQAAGIFALGRGRVASDVVVSEVPRPMEFGRYQHVTGLREMAALLARYAERPVDLEIIQNRLCFFAKKPFVTTDPDSWRWSFPCSSTPPYAARRLVALLAVRGQVDELERQVAAGTFDCRYVVQLAPSQVIAAAAAPTTVASSTSRTLTSEWTLSGRRTTGNMATSVAVVRVDHARESKIQR
ncbi:hypothetical protein [Amycolatopsis australiensis]|uniref:hypothetical protein n=1 Tax=Amycolatopsis australiensis TaxID=546364 RepID=UPI0009316EC0|nr:hypothetical protein [Amycolatopsis australiensis]